MLWPYQTPGIPDDLFERLPGIPISKREVRLLMISALKMEPQSVLWDVGAGTGTVSIEVALLCPEAHIVSCERDEEVAELIQLNADRFGVKNITVIPGSAPHCFQEISRPPDRIFIGGGQDLKEILQKGWEHLVPQGRAVAIANNLENLYRLSEGFSQLQARNMEVVQSAINRLETRGLQQIFAAVNPTFILSGEKIQ